MNKFKIFIFITIFMSALSGATYEHFLMPYDAKIAKSSIIESIKGAQKSIDIAMFMFTDKKIYKAIANKIKSNPKVKIRIVLDKSYNIEINPKGSKLSKLLKLKNIKLFIIKGLKKKKNKYGILHTKLMIVDRKVVFLGSANWTKSAFKYNYEILVKIKDKVTAELYSIYFNNILKNAREL